jgi:Major Facilitator Superfamily
MEKNPRIFNRHLLHLHLNLDERGNRLSNPRLVKRIQNRLEHHNHRTNIMECFHPRPRSNPPQRVNQNFFWSPTALYTGRRPVFLIVSFVSFAAVIWCALASSFEMLIAARIIAAFVCAAGEALAAGICADLFFLHERGWWMGIYMVGIASASSLGGIMSGFIIDSLGWRWHFWVCFHLMCC